MSDHRGLNVKLYDRGREPITVVELPMMWSPPTVIVWRGRHFALAIDGEFRETIPFIVPIEGEPAR